MSESKESQCERISLDISSKLQTAFEKHVKENMFDIPIDLAISILILEDIEKAKGENHE